MQENVNSVNAFVSQQLLTYIVMHKKEPKVHCISMSLCCCQTVSTGPHATLIECVSDSLGRNWDTREQKEVLLLGGCIV